VFGGAGAEANHAEASTALAEALCRLVEDGRVTTDDLRAAFDRAIREWEL
jgi:hypothetical protein